MEQEKKIWVDGIMFKSTEKINGIYASKCGQIYSSLRKKILKQSNHSRGYKCVGIYDKESKKTIIRLVHRLVVMAWLGVESNRKMHVDHIDSDKTNNNLDNLRVIPARMNCSIDRVNKNGYTGVKKQKGGSRYEAQINYKGDIVYLGTYDTPKQAHARYKIARMLLSAQ